MQAVIGKFPVMVSSLFMPDTERFHRLNRSAILGACGIRRPVAKIQTSF